MVPKTLYRIFILSCLFTIRSLQGWGSDSPSLPHLTLNAQRVFTDTLPPAKPAEVKPAPPSTKNPVDEVVKPIIKQIPKSKKQVKPVAIPGKLPVNTQKIVKPKVIIRRVGL